MYLTRLMYFSTANSSVDANVEQILDSARTFNKTEDVSGVLWFDGDIFIQVLEGQREAVSRTYHRIAADKRHQDIELVECVAIDERLFGDWTMGYLAATKANRAKILKYSGHSDMRPREMSPGSMLKFLLALEETPLPG